MTRPDIDSVLANRQAFNEAVDWLTEKCGFKLPDIARAIGYAAQTVRAMRHLDPYAPGIRNPPPRVRWEPRLRTMALDRSNALSHYLGTPDGKTAGAD